MYICKICCITDVDGNIVKQFGREVLSEITFDDAMLKVGIQGFDDFPYSFYRKTGTSELDVGDNNAVFIAYAPADKPKLAVAVVVPEGGFGSFGAAQSLERFLMLMMMYMV